MPIAKKKNNSTNSKIIERKAKTIKIKEDTSKMLSDYSKTLDKTQSFVIEQLIENYLDKLYDDILEKDLRIIQTKRNNNPYA